MRSGGIGAWVGCVAAEPFTEPQTVEAKPFERVDDLAEPGVVELRAHTEPDADAYLHEVANRCTIAAVSATRDTNGE